MGWRMSSGRFSFHCMNCSKSSLRYRPADMFCPEPVHPNSVGHLLIAHAWLTAMGW
ncbi:hypothetical protein Q2T83_10355 [Fervidibacter sacchari]|uniref:SGNH/GDSL hydrolase family protein n=1 Tax=Candidatus Fervidibacter sacchari TaxID=1448929 RepID=A0ABT2EQW3_9BACT|nr:hypothetical protein [Candidatus Fervidibacter sacchari]MCS3920301.1 hypothetical protein [Candidatus Fervidibacter sacchari]WKU14737.1 hypothetical protein Q2T83_10355 [Candidatus Fervidibacter sacchari]